MFDTCLISVNSITAYERLSRDRKNVRHFAIIGHVINFLYEKHENNSF